MLPMLNPWLTCPGTFDILNFGSRSCYFFEESFLRKRYNNIDVSPSLAAKGRLGAFDGTLRIRLLCFNDHDTSIGSFLNSQALVYATW